jgi:hypothetical protein
MRTILRGGIEFDRYYGAAIVKMSNAWTGRSSGKLHVVAPSAR